MKREANEQQVAAVVVEWLEALGADVYQEVDCSGGVADIVARFGVELWVVEVKTSLSLALLVQAMKRRRVAHRVYLAAPTSRTFRDVAGICQEIGVGLLRVHVGTDLKWDSPRVTIETQSLRWNQRPVALASRLRPEHKTHAKAGNVGAGGRWTPFRDTCEQLARTVKARPGLTLKEAVDSIGHHYRSSGGARSSLAKWIETGKVPGVAKRGSQLFPTDSASTAAC